MFTPYCNDSMSFLAIETQMIRVLQGGRTQLGNRFLCTLIWKQTEFRSVPNQADKYNQIWVALTRIRRRFVGVIRRTNRWDSFPFDFEPNGFKITPFILVFLFPRKLGKNFNFFFCPKKKILEFSEKWKKKFKNFLA